MPRIFPDAPDLVVSPDGAWAAALVGTSLRLYDLLSQPHAASLDGPSDGVDEAQPAPASAAERGVAMLSEPVADIERPEGVGRIVFLDSERLLHIFIEQGRSDEPAIIAAELIGVPTLHPVGPLARVAGAQRIVGVGPAGAVVAPNGPGADILHLRNGELVLQRTFMRGEVLSAIPAPERRFLLEQRGGFDLWDPATRGALSRLVLQTRQQTVQVGYVSNGRMLFALAAGPPAHVEIFRASDGRRFLEMDQPGRGLAADSAPSRLVIAVEERGGPAFLDLDLANGALQRLPLPGGKSRLYNFAVRPSATFPEIIVLTESSGTAVVRMSLPRLQTGTGQETPEPPSHSARGARPGSRPSAGEQGGSGSSTQLRGPRSRLQRPDQRTDLRADSRPDSRQEPRQDHRQDQRLEHRQEPRPELRPHRRPALPVEGPARMSSAAGSQYADEDDESGVETQHSAPPPVAPVSIVLGDPQGSRTEAAPSARERRLREMLGRSYDPAQSQSAWQWELLRWAQLLLNGTEDGSPQLPPDGGPVHRLGMRLRLTPVAQKLVSLLYAAEHLLGARPRGMRLLELTACLSSIYEEPTIVAELMPNSPLRSLGLVTMRPDGRLRLRPEVAAMLLDLPCPDLLAPAGGERELLAPGLYSHSGPYTRVATLLTRQPVLRVDALTEPRLLPALEQALTRALVHDAVVLLDGCPGIAYPAFTGTALLPSLRALLTGLRVPVIVASMPDAMPALGLPARPLPVGLVLANAVAPAPLIPSAPLPVGTTWRSPLLPVSAAFLEGTATSGRLELQVPGDRRAAIVIGPNATPDAYASAAYLATRDGAVLMVDVELTNVRALVLSMLLRQLPLCITAVPPGGPGTAWPPALIPFAQ